MGYVEDRAALQAREDAHIEVSVLFLFPPDAHGLTSVFVQLLFCSSPEDNFVCVGGCGDSVVACA